MCLAVPWHHVLNDLILSVQYDISQLSEVLHNILCFKVSFNQDCLILILIKFEIGVLDKLFNNRIKNSIVLFALAQP